MNVITVVGGGNSAHVLIPLLSNTDMVVNLLTRKPHKWEKTIKLDYVKPSGEYVLSFEGNLNKITDNPAEVIPESDVIILCLPVHIYRLSLHLIAPHIDRSRDIYIGTVYGQGGFNWMIEEIVSKFNLRNLKSFSFGLIPWICRKEKYGSKGLVFGAKPINVAATDSEETFDFLNRNLFKKIVFEHFGHGRFRRAGSFMSLTLSVDNQILHTSRMYDLYKEFGGVWNNIDEIPNFYRDFSDFAVFMLEGLDSDYSLIRNAIRERFPYKNFSYMLPYLELDNKTNRKKNKTILETFSNSDILAPIKAPVVERNGKLVLDMTHRFFKDDIYYGLCVAKSIAQMLGIRTGYIDEVLRWAQKMTGEPIIENKRLVIYDEIKRDRFKFGVPEAYGYSSIDEICD
jgi:hypothetical protein